MKFLLLGTCLLCSAIVTHAQKTKVMAFPITDYIIVTDSSTITQVKLPGNLKIKENAACLIKSVYSQKITDSVVTIGTGRCKLIKYYYFGFHSRNLLRKPEAGQLLYSNVTVPEFYDGLLFDVLSHSIILNNVQEELLADINIALGLRTAADEKAVFELLIADTKYTATEMAKLNNSMDLMIESGKFKGKKIFASMQAITNDDITFFLKYMKARPEKYAGNSWKFSEIVATWMAAGAPTTIKD
jgi:hypothetical protein